MNSKSIVIILVSLVLISGCGLAQREKYQKMTVEQLQSITDDELSRAFGRNFYRTEAIIEEVKKRNLFTDKEIESVIEGLVHAGMSERVVNTITFRKKPLTEVSNTFEIRYFGRQTKRNTKQTIVLDQGTAILVYYTYEPTSKQWRKRRKALTSAEQQLVDNGKVELGMSENALVALRGAPNQIISVEYLPNRFSLSWFHNTGDAILIKDEIVIYHGRHKEAVEMLKSLTLEKIAGNNKLSF